MKGVIKTGIRVGLVLALVLSLVLVGMPVAQATVDNQAITEFHTAYWHTTNADSIESGFLPGTYKTTGGNIFNQPDSTGAELVTPRLTYSPNTGLNIGTLSQQYLASSVPPYAWQSSNTPENEGWQAMAGQIVGSPFEFTLGLSASRSFSQTEFTGPGTQVVNISATTTEAADQLRVTVRIMNDQQVNAIITNVNSGGDIKMSPDGRSLSIIISNPDVGIPYPAEVTIAVTPSPDVTKATYKPIVNVMAWHMIESGDVQDSALEKTLELGTWKCEAGDTYSWHWVEWLANGVMFPEFRAIEGCNRINVRSETFYTYKATSDSVANITTQSSAWISSNLNNSSDNTHQAVVSPILNLTATETVMNVNPQEYLVPGSEYTWGFPNIEENSNFNGGAGIEGIVEFSTGFSVNRNLDQTHFPASGGTQTLTLNVTPEVPMERIEVHGNTDFGSTQGIATVTSVAGPNINIDPNGRRFHVQLNAPVVGTTYQWQVTFQIGPLPAGVVALDYQPNFQVRNLDIWNSGSSIGSSLSGNAWSLDGSTLLGTFAWQATGDYSWRWEETINKAVNWDGYARYTYPPPTQDEVNQTIESGIDWVRTQQNPDNGAWYWGRPERGLNQPEEPEKPNVGMTAFSLWSMLHGLVPQTDPQIQAGINYILSMQNHNTNSKEYGSFGDQGQVYETGLAILALRATNNPVYLDEIALGADFLVRAQNNEGKVFPNFPNITITSDDLGYGGWDYNYNSVHTEVWVGNQPQPCDPYVRADMSNSQYAIIGLIAAQEAGINIDPSVWAKAEIFINRCQNTDGGFTYTPIGDPQSGGSMGTITAACVWCLRLMGFPTEDTRIQAGLNWLDSYPFDGTNPAGNYRNWFLLSAAKAFTLCGRSPVLEQGTWYSDYARYLIDQQEADGRWANPNWPEGESNLNATTCGLLVLEKAILPPPPGLDFVTVDSMRIEFDTRPSRDKIKILQARLQLADGASYNLAEDDVTVTVDGVSVIIPKGSFKRADGEKYQCKSAQMAADGTTYRVNMDIDFSTGQWSFMIHDIDASVIDNSDGVDVTLMIGYMLAGQNVPMWIDYLVFPSHP